MNSVTNPEERCSDTSLSNTPKDRDGCSLEFMGDMVLCVNMPSSEKGAKVVKVSKQGGPRHRIKGLFEVNTQGDSAIDFGWLGESLMSLMHVDDLMTVHDCTSNGVLTASTRHVCELWISHQDILCFPPGLSANQTEYGFTNTLLQS